jgi:hypothetical protein
VNLIEGSFTVDILYYTTMTFAYESFPFAFYDKAKALLADFPVYSKCLIWVNYDLMSQQNKFTLLLKHPEDLYQPYTQTFYNNNMIEWDIALPEALTRFDALQKAIRHSSFEEFVMVEDEEEDNGWETWGDDSYRQPSLGKSVEQLECEEDEDYTFEFAPEENEETDDVENEEDDQEEDVETDGQDSKEEFEEKPNEEDLNSDEKEPTMEDRYDDLLTQMSSANSETDRQKIEKIWFSNMKNILYAKAALDTQMSCFMTK